MSVSKAQAKRIQESRKSVSRKKDEFLLKPVSPTRRQEIRYRKSLNNAIDSTRDSVMQIFNSITNPKSIDDILDEAYANMNWWNELNAQVKEGIDSLDLFQKEAFYHTITTSIGVNVAGFVHEQGLGELIDLMVDDNVMKITDLKNASQKRVADLIRNSMMGQEGKSPTLEKQIRESFNGVTKNQAKFIARDQTQRNVSSLNRFRQERAGIKKYKWITSKDSRVRSSHARMDGLIVSWETGKIQKTPLSVKRGVAGKNIKNVANGHVGQDYQCRCSAAPILEV